MTESTHDDQCQPLDWDSLEARPMVAGGFVVILRGRTPVPMTIELHPLPVGIVPVDYQGVRVCGRTSDVVAQVENPWTIERDSDQLPHGRIGTEFIGATKREFVPPKP